MRTAASSMSREEGSAKMTFEVEAKRLSDGKAPKEEGSMEPCLHPVEEHGLDEPWARTTSL